MKQYKIIPSGVQEWYSTTVGAGGGRFAYCSTLAVYVHDAETFQLLHLLTGHERAITGLTWSVEEPKLFATCGLDKRCIVWNAATGEQFKSINFSKFPHAIDWNPHNATEIAWSDSGGGISIWHIDTNKSIRATEGTSKEGFKVRVMRWNVRRPGVLACGHKDGSLSLVEPDTTSSSERLLRISGGKEHTVPVVDIRWDTLSPLYLLCGYKNGDVSLWDMETQSELQAFDRQGAGLSGLGWLEFAPGNFVTANNRTGVLRVWNVSQRHPLELVRVGRTGIKSVSCMEGSEKIVCAFADGSIGLFDVAKKQSVYRGLPGHTETIFDLRYSPIDPAVLATASYDGTIKVWKTPTMECDFTLTPGGDKGVVYGISWSPDGTMLVSGNMHGDVHVWDTVKAKLIVKTHLHEDQVFRVDWNKLDDLAIASTSSDGTLVISTPAGEVIRKYVHPKAVYGCNWSPFNSTMIVTGCHDGVVRVFDTSVSSDQPVRVLLGHKRRVFNTVWSPLLPNVVASGSDDLSIRVWNVSTGRSRILEGHTHNVRALVWSTELPWLLLSGSWDGTIRVWDTVRQKCTHVIHDHHADVYGLDAHPQRPFVFASSSRDTSLRFWIVDGAAPQLKLKTLLGRPWEEVLGTAEACVEPESMNADQYRLCGPGSKRLKTIVDKLENPYERYQAIFNFFYDADGLDDLFTVAEAVMTGERSKRVTVKVHHIKDVVSDRRATATRIAESKSRRAGAVAGGSSREVVMRQAADEFIKVGAIKRYCELMIELGEWEKALAVAPGVSVDFWKDLSLQYGRHLAAKQDAGAAPHFVAAGETAELAEFLVRRGQRSDALVVTLANGMGMKGHASSSGEAGGDIEAKEPDVEEKSDSELPAALQHRVDTIINDTAQHHLLQTEVVLSAGTLLSNNNKDGAVSTLLRGGEVELAYALATVLDVHPIEPVLERMAGMCERYGLSSLAIDVAKGGRDPTGHASLLAARLRGSPEEIERLYEDAAIRPRASWVETANAAIKNRKPQEAVTAWVMAGESNAAAELATKLLYEIFSKEVWDIPLAQQIIRPLSSLNATELDDTLRGSVLAYSGFVGALEAMWRRYCEIVPGLFRVVRSCIQRFNLGFPVRRTVLLLLEASYLLQENQIHIAHAVLARHLESTDFKIASAGDGSEEEDPRRAAARELYRQASQKLVEIGEGEEADAEEMAALRGRPNQVVVSGQTLPSGSGLKVPRVSLISGKPVQGPSVLLDDKSSYIMQSEAIMWSSVNSFSPTCSGEKLLGY